MKRIYFKYSTIGMHQFSLTFKGSILETEHPKKTYIHFSLWYSSTIGQ